MHCFKIANATVQMQVVKCPQDPSQFRHQIDIVSSKTNQSVSAEVNLICTCSCEEEAVENAEECTGRGTYKCGLCVCNPGTSGTMCECEGDSNPAGCLNPQSNTTVCSNRGDCICGYCFCKERVNRDEVSEVSWKYG
jgi:integrin beta 1